MSHKYPHFDNLYASGSIVMTGSMWISGTIGSHRPWLGNDSGSGLGLGGQQQAEQNVGQDFTFYVDPIGGSDYNDGKTSATALKTVKKACELVPMGLESKYGTLDCDDYNCAGVSALVYCMPGTHVWPGTMWGQNLTRFVGATSSFGSMTGPDWTVISASKEDGSIIEASFLPVTYDEDELKGTFVHLSGSNQIGWIYANESSTMPGGETRLWIAKGSYGIMGPEYFLSGDGLVSSSLELINFDTKFQAHRYFGNHTISHANYPAFKNIHFVNSSSAVRSSVNFVNCHNVVLYANKYGDHRDPDNSFTKLSVIDSEVYMRDSYFDFGDPNTPSGTGKRSINVNTNGYLNIERACVINAGRLTTQTDTARLNINCEVVFRDVTPSLWTSDDGIACFVHKGPSQTTYGLDDGILRFFEFTGSTTCWKGVESNMDGDQQRNGQMAIPPMYGKVESDYAVITRNGAFVQIDPRSSVTSSLGINKFSADGGLSATAQTNYLTMITGAGGVEGSLPLEATGFVQYATGSTILGNHSSDTHQFTGSTYFGALGQTHINNDGVVTWGAAHNFGTLTWTTDLAIVRSQGSNDLQLKAGVAEMRLTDGGTVEVTGSLHMSGAASIVLNAPGTELADASMNSSTVTMHVDEGTNKLFFKVKYSNGVTVKSGSIDLT